MKKIKLSKVSAVKQPVVPTPDSKDYIFGTINDNVSLPLDYWVEGYLMNEVVLGQAVLVNRTNRNGVECSGVLQTSEVTKITKKGFNTQNSVYVLEEINN